MYSWWTSVDVDALDHERAALLAVEQRPEDEARVRPRPAQPLDGALARSRALYEQLPMIPRSRVMRDPAKGYGGV